MFQIAKSANNRPLTAVVYTIMQVPVFNLYHYAGTGIQSKQQHSICEAVVLVLVCATE